MIQIISWRTTLGTSPTPEAPDIPWPLLWRPMTMACGCRRSSSLMEGKRKGMVQCARNRSSLLPCWRKIRNAGKAFFRYRTEWRIKSSRTGLLSLVPAVLGKHRGPTDSIFKVACTLDPGPWAWRLWQLWLAQPRQEFHSWEERRAEDDIKLGIRRLTFVC